MRTFIAIELSNEVRAGLAATTDRLRRLAPNARWVRADRLHLTLTFLGEIPDQNASKVSDALARIASHHRPFLLSLGGGGSFGSMSRPKVLWAALVGDLEPLHALHDSLQRELALLGHSDQEHFAPHVTVGRARDPRGDARLARGLDVLREVTLGPWPVGEVVFFASHLERDGMNYRPISRHCLTPNSGASS